MNPEKREVGESLHAATGSTDKQGDRIEGRTARARLRGATAIRPHEFLLIIIPSFSR